jgi:hypothetical protein
VFFYVSFCVALALYVPFGTAYACVWSTQVGDDEHALVAPRFGRVIVESEVPATVAVYGCVVFGRKLCAGGAAYGKEQRRDGEFLFHNECFIG